MSAPTDLLVAPAINYAAHKGDTTMTDFGTVTFAGITYTLTQQAYAAGTNDEMLYKARAKGPNGEDYLRSFFRSGLG